MPRWSALGSNDDARLGGPPLLILTSLAAGPRHGHALAKDIEEFAGVRLGPGSLYGALSRLEERGLIEALDPDERRRPYGLTPAGRIALEDALVDLRCIVDAASVRLRSSEPISPVGLSLLGEGQ
jgi:DNA-binding PadR family transcriptional regulator